CRSYCHGNTWKNGSCSCSCGQHRRRGSDTRASPCSYVRHETALISSAHFKFLRPGVTGFLFLPDARLLRDPRRTRTCFARSHPYGVSQACRSVSPGSQPGSFRPGENTTDQRRLRRAERSRKAKEVRSFPNAGMDRAHHNAPAQSSRPGVPACKTSAETFRPTTRESLARTLSALRTDHLSHCLCLLRFGDRRRYPTRSTERREDNKDVRSRSRH